MSACLPRFLSKCLRQSYAHKDKQHVGSLLHKLPEWNAFVPHVEVSAMYSSLAAEQASVSERQNQVS